MMGTDESLIGWAGPKYVGSLGRLISLFLRCMCKLFKIFGEILSCMETWV
jgi:hypothetical protein